MFRMNASSLYAFQHCWACQLMTLSRTQSYGATIAPLALGHSYGSVKEAPSKKCASLLCTCDTSICAVSLRPTMRCEYALYDLLNKWRVWWDRDAHYIATLHREQEHWAGAHQGEVSDGGLHCSHFLSKDLVSLNVAYFDAEFLYVSPLSYYPRYKMRSN